MAALATSVSPGRSEIRSLQNVVVAVVIEAGRYAFLNR